MVVVPFVVTERLHSTIQFHLRHFSLQHTALGLGAQSYVLYQAHGCVLNEPCALIVDAHAEIDSFSGDVTALLTAQ